MENQNYGNPNFNNPQGFDHGNQGNFMTEKLPNTTTVLVLGIASIPMACCYGIGLILGIIALVLGKKDEKLYQQNPRQYTGIQNIKTGKILALIGIILAVLQIIGLIYIFAVLGWDEYQRMLNDFVNAQQQSGY